MDGSKAMANTTKSSVTNSVTLSSHTMTRLPDGGENYNHTLSDGRQLNVPIPPSDFNPLSASANQFEDYDLPAKPINSVDLSSWRLQMSTYKSKAVPTSTQDAFDFASMSQPVNKHYMTNGSSTATSVRWGGYNAVGGVPGTAPYVAIKDEITVPSVGYNSSCSSIYGVPIMGSSWVDLGGGTNGSTSRC